MNPTPNPTPALTMPAETRESIRYTLAKFGPMEATYAHQALLAGRVNGDNFAPFDGCGCLLSTMREAAEEWDGRENYVEWHSRGPVPLVFYPRHPDRPEYAKTVDAQNWFMRIHPGDIPANSAHARLAAEVISEWLREQVVDLSAMNPLLAPESTRQAIAHLLKEA